MKNEKMISMAKTIDTVLKVLKIFGLIGMVICLLIGVFSAVTGMHGLVSETFSFGSLHLNLDPSNELTAEFLGKLTAPILFAGALSAWAFVNEINKLRKIDSYMKAGEPFHKEVPGAIRKLGWAVILAGMISILTSNIASIWTWFLTRSSDVYSSIIADVSVNVEINLSFILYAFIIFFLAYVFQYGVQLQKESDETL